MSKVLKGVPLGKEPSPLPPPPSENGGSKSDAQVEERPDSTENSAVRQAQSEEVLQKAQDEAMRLVEEAKSRSQKILEEAQAEAKTIRKEAEKEGYRKGYEKGQREAQSLLDEAEKTRQEAWQEKEAIVAAAEADILGLSLALAEKVLRHQLEVNPDYLALMLRALPVDQRGEEVVVKVPPGRVDVLHRRQDVLEGLFGTSGFRVEADPELADGLVLETASGTVDATVEGQMRELAEKLGEVIGDEE